MLGDPVRLRRSRDRRARERAEGGARREAAAGGLDVALLGLQRTAGNAAVSGLVGGARLQRTRPTRQSVRELNRPTAEGTRARRREEAQLRQARHRLNLVSALRAEREQLAADQNMPATTAGGITYGAIQNWRRNRMTADITFAMLGTGSAATAAISGVGPGLGYARGHLLARSLGGSGADPRNLVPIAHAATNVTTMWHQVERPVRAHLLANQDHRVRYEVSVDYPANRQVVPERLRFVARCYNAAGLRCDDLHVADSIANAAV